MGEWVKCGYSAKWCALPPFAGIPRFPVPQNAKPLLITGGQLAVEILELRDPLDVAVQRLVLLFQ
jgi:hypothetical protein